MHSFLYLSVSFSVLLESVVNLINSIDSNLEYEEIKLLEKTTNNSKILSQKVLKETEFNSKIELEISTKKEKNLAHEKNMLDMLKRVNEHYEYKFNDVLIYAIRRAEFNILVLKNDKKEMPIRHLFFCEDSIY